MVEFSPNAFSETAKVCLPRDFYENHDWNIHTDTIGTFLSSHKDLRMYGSPVDFCREIFKFRDIPLNYLIYPIADYEPCSASHKIHLSIGKVEYMTKTDILLYLEIQVLNCGVTALAELAKKILIMFLRKHQKQLQSNLEFVRWNLVNLNDFQPFDLLHNALTAFSKSKKISENLMLAVESPENVSSYLQSICSFAVTEEEKETVKMIAADLTKRTKLKKDPKEVGFKLHLTELLFSYLKSYMEKKPEWFQPYSQLKDTKAPIVIRLFQDRGRQYVMIPELISVLKTAEIESHSKFFEYDASPEMIPIICIREVYKLINRDDMKRIEFVLIIVERTKHAAIPIQKYNGHHCIPSVDALFELLRYVIKVKKVFQRSENWDRVDDFIKKLTSYFMERLAFTFYIDKRQVSKMIEDCDIECQKLNLPKASTEIGDYNDGFEIEDINNEFKKLKLDRMFPDISKHKQLLFETLMQSKCMDSLRTCDMFLAIETAQLLCLFERFPRLIEFLHSQKSCNRLLNMICVECAVFVPENSLQKTVWKEYEITDVRKIACYHSKDKEKNGKYGAVEMNDGQRIHSNCSTREPFRNKTESHWRETPEKLKMLEANFDNEDQLFRLCDRPIWKTTLGQEFLNLAEPKNYEEKYIRTMLLTMMNHKQNKRVLVEELITSLPKILRQESIFNKKSFNKLLALGAKYDKQGPTRLYDTISLDELKSILEDFNINKAIVNLIPDFRTIELVVQEKTLFRSPIFINSSGGKIISSLNLCYSLFEIHIAICDWSYLHQCGNKKQIRFCNTKDKIIEIFRELMETENYYRREEDFSKYEIQVRNILKQYSNDRKKSSLPLLKHLKVHDNVNIGILLNDKILGSRIHRFQSDKEWNEICKLEVEAWRVKVALMILSLHVFFGSDHSDIYDCFLKFIAFEVPFTELKDQSDLENFAIYGNSFLKMEKKTIQENFEEFKERKTKNQLNPTVEDVFMDVFDEIRNGSFLKNTMDKKEGLKCESTPELKEDKPVIVKKPKEKSKGKPVEPEPIKEIKPSEAEKVEWCSKCFRTSEYCENVKKQCSTWKGKAKEMENELEIVKKELDKFKEKENKMEEIFKKKYEEKLEEVKKKVEKETLDSSRVLVGNMKSENIRLKETNIQLERKDKKNELEIKNLKKEIQEMNRNFMEKIQKVERGAVESSKGIEDILRDKIDKLEDQLSRLKGSSDDENLSSTPSASSPPPPPSHSKSIKIHWLPPKYPFFNAKKELIKLKEMRGVLNGEKSIGRATDRVRRIKNSSDRTTNERVSNELSKFKIDHANCLNAINSNISLIETNPKQIKPDQLQPIPSFPSLSKWFMNLNNVIKNTWSLPSNQPGALRRPPEELEDTKCCICLREMTTPRGTYKCSSCHRRWHNDCIGEWIEKGNNCPMCRGKMLHPNEYPDLH